MDKNHYRLVSHHPWKHFGITPIVALLFFIVALRDLHAKQVSFFVPEDHEKYDLIDSLFNLMVSLDHEFIKIENNLIRDKAIRLDELVVKEKYFKHQLKYNLSTTDNVLEYCKALRDLDEVKMHYFNELLSTLEGDIRAKCFILWKNARTELSQIIDIIQRFDISESSVNKITYYNNETQDEAPALNEPSLEDILGEDIMGSDEEYENPFAHMENTVEKIDRSVTESSEE